MRPPLVPHDDNTAAILTPIIRAEPAAESNNSIQFLQVRQTNRSISKINNSSGSNSKLSGAYSTTNVNIGKAHHSFEDQPAVS